MFLRCFCAALGSAIFGGATAAGCIALLTKLGVVPRIIARFQEVKYTLPAECTIILGAITGCVTSITKLGNVGNQDASTSFWQGLILVVVSLCVGVFIGCQAMALAEILNMFPILFHRAKLQIGLRWTVIALALGKLVGSLWYFAYGYQNS